MSEHRTPEPSARVDQREREAAPAPSAHGIGADAVVAAPALTASHYPARRRLSRVARAALVLSGIGFAMWYWMQVRGEFWDGFQNGPQEIEGVIRDGVR